MKFKLLYLIIPLLAIPVIVFLTSQRQDIRQRAGLPGSQICIGQPNRVNPANRGIIVDDIHSQEAKRQLATDLRYVHHNYTYDPNNPNRNDTVLMIGKHYDWNDPDGLKILMDNNLDNTDFNGTVGRGPPDWSFWTGGRGSAIIANDSERMITPNSDPTKPPLLDKGSYVRITHTSGSPDTHIAQRFKERVRPGQRVVFGTWVKTSDPSAVKIYIANADNTSQTFSYQSDLYSLERQMQYHTYNPARRIIPGEYKNFARPEWDRGPRWTFVEGYIPIPNGFNNFQLVLAVTKPGVTVSFDEPAVAVTDSIDFSSYETLNVRIADIMRGVYPSPATGRVRCGLAWLIGNEPNFELSAYFYNPLPPYPSPLIPLGSPDFYALVYHEFYNLIKYYDSNSTVLPGGFSHADSHKGGYVRPPDQNRSAIDMIEAWRNSYHTFFNTNPPLDAMNVHFYENQPNSWASSDGLKSYLQGIRDKMKTVPEWNNKPIWLTEFGVVKNAPNYGADFAKAANDLLMSNRSSGSQLYVQKWFWFDLCGADPGLATLFKVKRNEKNELVCMNELSAAGRAYNGVQPPLNLLRANMQNRELSPGQYDAQWFQGNEALGNFRIEGRSDSYNTSIRADVYSGVPSSCPPTGAPTPIISYPNNSTFTNNDPNKCFAVVLQNYSPSPPPAVFSGVILNKSGPCDGKSSFDTPSENAILTPGTTITLHGWGTFCSGPNWSNRERVYILMCDQGTWNNCTQIVGRVPAKPRPDVVAADWTCARANPNDDGWIYQWVVPTNKTGRFTLRAAAVNDPATSCVSWSTKNISISSTFPARTVGTANVTKPTNTPIPTKKPTPTRKPTPTSTRKPTPTPTRKPTPTSTRKPTNTPIPKPKCSTNIANCGSCNAPANTCGNDNGIKSCSFTGPAPCNPVPINQQCGVDKCSAGYRCSSSRCVQNTINTSLSFKLEGISTKRGNISVKVDLKKQGNIIHSFPNLNATSNNNGVYTISLNSINPNTYDIYIKPLNHLTKKFANVSITSTNTMNLTSPFVLAGDMNNDDKINITDLNLMLRNYTQSSYDLNRDGKVNSIDTSFIIKNKNKQGEK